MGQESSRTFPIYDFQLLAFMGTYWQNNGIVVFVDENGKQYVTPFCFQIKQMLRDAGYLEKPLNVPLSNGEQIVDPTLAATWNSLFERANGYPYQTGSGLKP